MGWGGGWSIKRAEQGYLETPDETSQPSEKQGNANGWQGIPGDVKEGVESMRSPQVHRPSADGETGAR